MNHQVSHVCNIVTYVTFIKTRPAGAGNSFPLTLGHSIKLEGNLITIYSRIIDQVVNRKIKSTWAGDEWPLFMGRKQLIIITNMHALVQ